ncbi:hypothetical protein JIN85_11430 [Luteolibacter pohnpeiensis]|uniref:Uncharacterized protein n=1 Tax=Luteolibacter pohnpeiensis TaxID=454153 RepID=A0A934S4K4_9BACT|nr:hypothetical protein [Luteolibacter pohnpeiensis]MBK1883030.1 hypothetical protein [Luteolibacter pohnpeiensis]
MAKTLCDWSKSDIKERAAELMELTRAPKFFCRKCARVSTESKFLCKPMRFDRQIAKNHDSK